MEIWVGKRKWSRHASCVRFITRKLVVTLSSSSRPSRDAQKEMMKRTWKQRGKWLLGSDLKVTNAMKRCKAEDGVWIWWKVTFLFLLIFKVY